MTATIGPAEPQDREALLSLLARQLEEHDIALDAARLTGAVDGILESNVPTRGFFLVAREGIDLIGLAYASIVWTLEHGGLAAWLEELYVLPERRGDGIGSGLVRAVVLRASELGCGAVDLEVEESHSRAAHLYEREGFVPHRRSRWVRRLA